MMRILLTGASGFIGQAVAKRASERPEAKSPACPATPPSARALSSCTSPRSGRPSVGSNSVGAIARRSAEGR